MRSLFPPEYTLEHNYFQFGDKVYKQTMGTAMGTPQYANLFMDHVETKFLETQSLKPTMWYRYIDDVFSTWTHGREQLEQFLQALNLFHPTIKFTPLRDCTFYKGERFKKSGILDVKSLNSFMYLHYRSAHPKSIFSAIVKGELVHVLIRSAATPKHYSKRLEARSLSLREMFTWDPEFKATPLNLQALKAPPLYLQHRPAPPPPEQSKKATPPGTRSRNFKTNPKLILRYAPQYSIKDLKEAIRLPQDMLDIQAPEPQLVFTKSQATCNHIVRAKTITTKVLQVSETLSFVRPNNINVPCGKLNCLCCKVISGKHQ